ncbi:hypothetical protein K7H91_13235 [Martelella mediterranea]|uniref:hypothetical protein n=1 Tax=Martelella mediterranea TaxID=293089 RepID=UPI001E36C80B|nr:hypothetical protein [Martelella mediterranea]MCD1634735.1 hypothetical protein [Martelella mediterranea]
MARAGLRFSLLGPGADIRSVVALAEAAHAESRFSYISFSSVKVEAIVARIVARPEQSACILAMRGSDVVGMLWCSVGASTKFCQYGARRTVRATLGYKW